MEFQRGHLMRRAYRTAYPITSPSIGPTACLKFIHVNCATIHIHFHREFRIHYWTFFGWLFRWLNSTSSLQTSLLSLLQAKKKRFCSWIEFKTFVLKVILHYKFNYIFVCKFSLSKVLRRACLNALFYKLGVTSLLVHISMWFTIFYVNVIRIRCIK